MSLRAHKNYLPVEESVKAASMKIHYDYRCQVHLFGLFKKVIGWDLWDFCDKQFVIDFM